MQIKPQASSRSVKRVQDGQGCEVKYKTHLLLYALYLTYACSYSALKRVFGGFEFWRVRCGSAMLRNDLMP